MPSARSRMSRIVVSVATISTVNITGLRAILRGSSFLNESKIAGTRIEASAMEALLLADMDFAFSGEMAGVHRQMLDDGTERERREIGEATNDHDDADQKTDKQTAVRGECAFGW